MMKSGEFSAGRQTIGDNMGSAANLDQTEGDNFNPDRQQEQYRSLGSSNYGNPNFVPPPSHYQQ